VIQLQPGDWNWAQAADIGDGVLDRTSRDVVVVVPISNKQMDALEEGRLEDALGDADAELLAEIEAEAGRQPIGRPASVGRGASAVGLAIQFGEALATLGGAAAAIKGTIMGVRAAYQRLSRRLGRLPLVSIGAAEHLAAADFIDRHNTASFTLVGSGDVMSSPPDRDFTGGDAFWIILADADQRLHFYQVDAYGRVTYVGAGAQVPNHWDPPPPPRAED
jgi:hypothetical protein